ncbi:MAG: hypothetical protein ABFD00_10390 [Chloroherpetonaceae bacterium]
MKKQRIAAGDISRKLMTDKTKYNALEVGHAMTDDIEKHLDDCIEKHLNYIDEEGNYPYRKLDQFAVVMVIAKDNLIKNLIRRKFYCCPFLPSPRPNQAVFLYNKAAGKIIKRLWVLPSDMVMAELASLAVVDKKYQSMQAWAIAFFEGKFWEFVRYESGTNMVSQQEYISNHREELIQAGCNLVDPSYTNPFDFDKINIKKVIDTQEALV